MSTTICTLDAIAQRIHEMWALVDRREAGATVAYCAIDFQMTAMGMTLDRETYAAMMSGRESATYNTRHVITNLRCVDDSDGSMNVEFLATVHRLDDGDDFATISIGDVAEEWVLENDVLVLRKRDISIAFDGRPVDKRGL
jgi:hypothetical protein